MSYELIRVTKNNHRVEPGVYLAFTTTVGSEQGYVLQSGNDKNRIVHRSVVEHIHPHNFMEEMFKSHRDEIQRLQQEVDDLRAPVKLPGDVYDALKKIQRSFHQQASYALITMYEYFGLESAEPNEVGPLMYEIKKVAYWRDGNLNEYNRMLVYGYEREMTAKEKWVMDFIDTIRDDRTNLDKYAGHLYDSIQQGFESEEEPV